MKGDSTAWEAVSSQGVAQVGVVREAAMSLVREVATTLASKEMAASYSVVTEKAGSLEAASVVVVART